MRFRVNAATSCWMLMLLYANTLHYAPWSGTRSLSLRRLDAKYRKVVKRFIAGLERFR